MSQPYRPTYKMLFITEKGEEIIVGNFERLDEASAFARKYVPEQNGLMRLMKHNKAEDTYVHYEKWTY